jgi:photosystem II stability/assembly factor-like uncharacterized protein
LWFAVGQHAEHFSRVLYMKFLFLFAVLVLSLVGATASSWTAQDSGTTTLYESVHFTDANNGWIVGGDGTIIKTANGGAVWYIQTSGTSDWLLDVYFTNALNGWAVGESGTIVYTTNGGVVWDIQTSGTNQWLFSVHFTDALNGWAVGGDGTIIKTANGGADWDSQSSVNTQALFSVYFTDATTGWAVGDLGTTLKWVSTAVRIPRNSMSLPPTPPPKKTIDAWVQSPCLFAPLLGPLQSPLE